MLDPTFQKRWIKALRSGNFKQARKKLVRKGPDDTYSFCCLGVAYCMNADGKTYNRAKADAAIKLKLQFPPEDSVRKWTKDINFILRSGNAIVTYKGECCTLAELNDRGVPFRIIADLIEEQL